MKSIYQTYAFVPEMSKETYLITMLLGKTDFELPNKITHSILGDTSQKTNINRKTATIRSIKTKK